MVVGDIRAFDDLTEAERVQLEAAIEDALISQAKVDLSNESIDVRTARPTADVTMDADVTADTWILTAAGITGPGTDDGFVAWTLNDRQNAALWGFYDLGNPAGAGGGQKMLRATVANATTTLAVVETSQVQGNETPAAFFRQVFLWKKNETMTLTGQYATGADNAEIVWLIKIAEPAGQTFGCKV